MKRIVWIALLLAAVSCSAQVTPNISLNLPVFSSPNWNVPLNQNFTILDNYLGGVNTFPNPLKASITGTALNLTGGILGSVPYQNATGTTTFVPPNTSASTLFLCETGTGTVGAAPAWCAGNGSVTSFTAPSISWPTWLVPTVTNSTTTPSLTVSASAIPNSALANASTTVNGTTCTLGSPCTPPAPAGTLTGATLAAGVTASSLTSVGTIGTGVWQGTPIANAYIANHYTVVNGVTCTLGAACTVSSGAITVGTTTISGGTSGRILYNNAGVLGNLATTGTGSTVVLNGNPTLTAATVTGTMAAGVASTPQFLGTGTLALTGCSIAVSSGGMSVGQFLSGVSGTCTVVINLSATPATNGWACDAHDLTTPADVINQTATSTTSATISGTAVTGDLITFKCMAY